MSLRQPEQNERIRLHPQELALLFIIFAMGARHALEWEQGEGPDEEYSLLARTCLTKGDFMTHHTICGVQTLVCLPSSLCCWIPAESVIAHHGRVPIVSKGPAHLHWILMIIPGRPMKDVPVFPLGLYLVWR
jgi:hypothetical protein